ADLVACQRLAHRLDDGNAARNRCFIVERNAALFRKPRKRGAMMGEQRLVGCGDMLAALQRFLDKLPRNTFRAANQFDYEVNVTRPRKRQRIVFPAHAGQINATILRLVACRNGHKLNSAARGCSEMAPACSQNLDHARPDRAEAGDTNAKSLCHVRLTLVELGCGTMLAVIPTRSSYSAMI